MTATTVLALAGLVVAIVAALIGSYGLMALAGIVVGFALGTTETKGDR